MRNTPNPEDTSLHLAYLHKAMAGWPIGHTIEYHHRLTSTMPVAQARARAASDPARVAGTVVVAEEQTAGRGRSQRRWVAPPGRALLMSIVLAPPLLPPEPTLLPMIGGLAVLEAVGALAPALAPNLWLKWPNDLLVLRDDEAGKLAGLIVENTFAATALRHSVLGVGINVNQSEEELPPSRLHGVRPMSLRVLLGRALSREDLLVTFCRALTRFLAAANRPDPGEIHRAWQNALINLGRPVTVRRNRSWGESSPLRGTAVGTTPTGALVVEDGEGEVHTVSAEDAEFTWGW